ncbi:MAG: hypothetical protein JXR48_13695 [Candidatus Delongbacteria bacterium]|nr:hypothetical protein [Candidatus Delongbacteria bacterium]MBN2836010.1 hypothetical protein [Candidatus Delongbacteria bacterium]
MIILLLFVILSATNLIGQQNDSLTISYNEYYNYKNIDSRLFYNKTDSVSTFKIDGYNVSTFYSNDYKLSNYLDAEFLRRNQNYLYGARFRGDYSTNEILERPAIHNFSIIPILGWNVKEYELTGGVGYKNTKENNLTKEGYDAFSNIKYDNTKNELDYIHGDADYRLDNLDDDNNINSKIGLRFSKIFLNDIVISSSGTFFFDKYHYDSYKTESKLLQSDAYDFKFGVNYIVNNNWTNESSLGFMQKNKVTDSKGSVFSENETDDFTLENQVYFMDVDFQSKNGFKIVRRSEEFSFESNKNSYTDYKVSLNNNSLWFRDNCEYGYDLEYSKYEYKSLIKEKNDDRDIISGTLSPYWRSKHFDSLISFSQYLNLDYYHLVNLSSLKSANNHEDYSIKSTTNIKISSVDYLEFKLGGIFDTRYQVYDYDTLFVKSIVLKNFSTADSITFKTSDNLDVTYGFKYGFEQLGRLNFDDFKFEVKNTKYHIFNSLALSISDDYSNLIIEYYYYKIDSYRRDRDSGKDVFDYEYIVHGPKSTVEIITDFGMKISGQFKYNIFKDREESSLSLILGYSF